ncbi:MAG: HAMP domain-containing sensor histidine kinase [Negativicutes bacterium]|jgi:signal transduction histidine kinase
MTENRKKVFTKNAANELKTPLTGIISNADMIVNYVENIEDAKILAKNIQNDAERLATMTKNLFSLARLQGSEYRENMELQPVDLTKIIREAIALCRISLTENQQELRFNYDDDCLIDSDPELLRQAFVNLIDNAARYSPRGGKIVVSMFCEIDCVRISVADNGSGISECDVDRIFDEFYRADKSLAQAIAGSGLGLAITKQIIEVLNGQIKVESTVGTGTEFIIKLSRRRNVS